MTDEAAVLTERRDHVLVVTINRLGARHAVNEAVARGIAVALDEPDADPELAVGILAESGGYFCAGMNLKALAAGKRPWIPSPRFAEISERSSDKPLVTVGGGLIGRPRALAHSITNGLPLTGDPIRPERGHELGLVNRLPAGGAAVAQALDLAATLTANGPLDARDPRAERLSNPATASDREEERGV